MLHFQQFRISDNRSNFSDESGAVPHCWGLTSARKPLLFFGGLALALFVSGSAFAETSNAYCKAASGLGYWIYEIDDQNKSFRLRDDSHLDFLEFPLSEDTSYKERVVSFSKKRIKYCRLIKYRNDEVCYTLDRVKWELTTQHFAGEVAGDHAAHGQHGLAKETGGHGAHSDPAKQTTRHASKREALAPEKTPCSQGLPSRRSIAN
ncbi:hypothetical protein FE236_11485 [Mariprofundus erugo]|uniref:hypothetical protein n=1 Tax=Mariprofundus erugo TaxID=2528639 RepID=UPI0010FEE332|nr:hypothetical protein [Mariprofundus erugo]TLS74457.1 hypothetical protein FE236_11485 [Mariprofundus erugo]